MIPRDAHLKCNCLESEIYYTSSLYSNDVWWLTHSDIPYGGDMQRMVHGRQVETTLVLRTRVTRLWKASVTLPDVHSCFPKRDYGRPMWPWPR